MVVAVVVAVVVAMVVAAEWGAGAGEGWSRVGRWREGVSINTIPRRVGTTVVNMMTAVVNMIYPVPGTWRELS